MTKTRKTLYWVTTAILVLALAAGGFAGVAQIPENVQGLSRLGYPAYFGVIIGFWKMAGAIALLLPGMTRLKEWAYAGIFFNMTGAMVSHALIGDGVSHLIAPMFFTLLAIASWALRPQSRTIGKLFTSDSVPFAQMKELQAS
jgi:uncharacterized membrane protein YphA (DoxX/SURF4 family)